MHVSILDHRNSCSQDLRSAYCALHAPDAAKRTAVDVDRDARESFNELLMHFYRSAVLT